MMNEIEDLKQQIQQLEFSILALRNNIGRIDSRVDHDLDVAFKGVDDKISKLVEKRTRTAEEWIESIINNALDNRINDRFTAALIEFEVEYDQLIEQIAKENFGDAKQKIESFLEGIAKSADRMYRRYKNRITKRIEKIEGNDETNPLS